MPAVKSNATQNRSSVVLDVLQRHTKPEGGSKANLSRAIAKKKSRRAGAALSKVGSKQQPKAAGSTKATKPKKSSSAVTATPKAGTPSDSTVNKMTASGALQRVSEVVDSWMKPAPASNGRTRDEDVANADDIDKPNKTYTTTGKVHRLRQKQLQHNQKAIRSVLRRKAVLPLAQVRRVMQQAALSWASARNPGEPLSASSKIPRIRKKAVAVAREVAEQWCTEQYKTANIIRCFRNARSVTVSDLRLSQLMS